MVLIIIAMSGVETATKKWGGGGGGGGHNCTLPKVEYGRLHGNVFAFIYQDGLSWHLRALHCTLEMPAPKKLGDIAIS